MSLIRKFRVIPKNHTHPFTVDERDFELLFNITYLPYLQFDHWEIEQEVKKRCKRAKKRGKISHYANWLGSLHEKKIHEALVPDITIQEVHPEVGYGVITNRSIEPFEFLGEYTGIVRRRALFFANLNDYCFAYPREWLTFHPLTIDGENAGNFTRFINHSDKPNLESIAVIIDGAFHIVFRTLHKIEAGTELTYNYGELYWQNRQKIEWNSRKVKINDKND